MGNTMSELKGMNAQRIKSIAREFDSQFSETFIELPLRMMLWTEPHKTNTIFVKVLASDADGRFIAYEFQYQLDTDEFYARKRLSRIFNSAKDMEIAKKALTKFIGSITQMSYPINKVLLDLGVMHYYLVKIGASPVEQGSIDLHICSYADEAKEDFGFADAKTAVGSNALELAYF